MAKLRSRTGQLLFTAEHASNRIPKEYQDRFRGAEAALHSHRGWDPGTRELAETLAGHFRVPLFMGQWSRLLIELNRSPHHPRLWSEFSRDFTDSQKQALLRKVYSPYREQIWKRIGRWVQQGRRVIHIGVHSFTPVFEEKTRSTDIGLLFDPGRRLESVFCRRWQQALKAGSPELTVHRNQPYLGKADGLVTWLRKEFPAEAYLGIELEVNQRFPLGPRSHWSTLQNRLIASLEDIRRELH